MSVVFAKRSLIVPATTTQAKLNVTTRAAGVPHRSWRTLMPIAALLIAAMAASTALLLPPPPC